jgi:heme-degrading monooxygenase HmoA
MYIAIRRYQGVTGSTEEIARRGEQVVSIFQQVSGFIGWYLLEAGGGNWATVSIFEDQAGAEESSRVAANFIRQNLAEFFPNPPEITMGEVVLHGQR